MSDNVVKYDLADAYQACETPLAASGFDFAPCFSTTSPTKTTQKAGFSPAEVTVISQAQAKNEDWQVFNAPLGDVNLPDALAVITEDEDAELPVISQGHAEGYDVGYQEGYDEGYDEGVVLGQSEGQAKAKGFEAGQQQAQALEEQRNKDIQVALGYLAQVTDTLSDELLQPMQTLALHLAKELVRGELSLSTHAIERLIMLSMEQLQTTQSTIQVHMNPLEFERLKKHNSLPDQVVLQPNNDVSMGSIKVEQAGSWVEDLIEDRLAQISLQAFGFVDEKFVDPIQQMEPEMELEIKLSQESDETFEADESAEELVLDAFSTGESVEPLKSIIEDE